MELQSIKDVDIDIEEMEKDLPEGMVSESKGLGLLSVQDGVPRHHVASTCCRVR